VFALGLCLFYLLEWDRGRRSLLARYPTLIAAASVAAVVGCALIAMPHWLDLLVPLPPVFLLVTLAMMVFVLALARSPPGLFLNAPTALVGRVSFSAYLLHLAILEIFPDWASRWIDFHATGWPAIAAFAFALICIVPIVVAGSWCTYRLIETPMIHVGKALIRRRRWVVAKGLS
jgi:peptidoglycan/LPS O-acetylase OafA/YrhL